MNQSCCQASFCLTKLWFKYSLKCQIVIFLRLLSYILAYMFYLEPVFEFSRHNCVAICSFLVPANLIATITTLMFIVQGESLMKSSGGQHFELAPTARFYKRNLFLRISRSKLRPSRMRWSKRIASALAIALFLHVSTWFIIGVITPVTFILFGLGTSCLIINQMAVIYRRKIVRILNAILPT